MPGRSLSLSNYRFGFNGKEKDNEIKGDGSWQDYGMRSYDSRLGRFPSLDPLAKKYPELTPYQFASNCPIRFIDIDGKEAGEPGYNSFKSALSVSNPVSLKNENDAIKNLGVPAVEVAGEIVEGTADAMLRVGFSLVYGIAAGYYYAATEKKINSFVFGFDWQKGFYSIGDPESDENTKKLLKSVVSLEASKLTTIDISNPVTDLYVNTTKDALIDEALDKAVPTSSENQQENSSPSTNSSTNKPPTPSNTTSPQTSTSVYSKPYESRDKPKVPAMPKVEPSTIPNNVKPAPVPFDSDIAGTGN